MAKKEDKQKFGDIVENHDLIKRTLMVAAFPALIKGVTKDGEESFEGFLPGFDFAEVADVATEEELVEMLQDMLDDEVEELVVFGKSLPFVDEDEVLMEKYPEYKIVYLDINVYATKEELDYYDSCTHDCASCGHHCHDEDCDCEDDYDECDCCDDEDCDCCDDDECDCCDDDCDDGCDCGCHHHDDCDDDCACDDDGCDCGCHEHDHNADCDCHFENDLKNNEKSKEQGNKSCKKSKK